MVTAPNRITNATVSTIAMNGRRICAAIMASFDVQRSFTPALSIAKDGSAPNVAQADWLALTPMLANAWTNYGYGLLIDINAGVNTAIPQLTFNVAGINAFGDAVTNNFILAPSPAQNGGSRSAQILVLPASLTNGVYAYTPWAFRNQLAATGAGIVPPAAAAPVITCTTTDANVKLNYTLVTRGHVLVDDVSRAYGAM
jgi:hypothetical protein